MNYGFFDAEGFRRRLQGLTDDELITTGKTVSPEASHWEDPKTIAENAQKYQICKEEWRKRHPKRDRGRANDLETPTTPV